VVLQNVILVVLTRDLYGLTRKAVDTRSGSNEAGPGDVSPKLTREELKEIGNLNRLVS
jgi:hypothetical protein